MPNRSARRPYLQAWWWAEAARFIAEQGRYAGACVRRPSLRLLLLGYFGYCLARKAARVALVVFAFDLAGVQGAAAITVAQLLPAAVLAPLGSAIADRFHPARSLALGYIVQGVSLGAAGVAVQFGGSLALVATLAAVASASFAITRPVYLATLPDVVDYPDELTLGNAASAWVDGVASIIGPLLAGIGLVFVGAGEVLLGLAVVCLVAALASLGLVVRRQVRTVQGSLRETLLGGFAVLRRDRQVTALVGLTALQYAVVGLLDVLVVVFVVDVAGGQSASAGLLAAAVGVGSTVGGLGSVLLAGRTSLGPTLVFGAAVTGVPLIALGLGPGLVVAGCLLAGYGVGKALVSVSAQTLLQRTVSDSAATRVFGIQEGLIQAGTAAGAALGPLLVLVMGAQAALVVAGLLLPLAVFIARPTLRILDGRAYVPGPVFAMLRRVPFLAVLPLRSLEQLARQADELQVDAGVVVVKQGDVGERYFVVVTGAVNVVADGARVRELGPGDGFGEIALLRDVPRTATVTALTPVELVSVEREAFLDAVTGTTHAHEAAHQVISERLESDERRSEDDHRAPD